MQHQRTTTHKTRSGASPPRSSPSLAIARSVGSSGSDGGLTVAIKHRSPPVGRGRRLLAPLPPSQPSSQKAVSCTLFASSQGAGLICARGLRPLARFCSLSSAVEALFGSANDVRPHSGGRVPPLPPSFGRGLSRSPCGLPVGWVTLRYSGLTNMFCC